VYAPRSHESYRRFVYELSCAVSVMPKVRVKLHVCVVSVVSQ
jgi:hypothetical protein